MQPLSAEEGLNSRSPSEKVMSENEKTQFSECDSPPALDLKSESSYEILQNVNENEEIIEDNKEMAALYQSQFRLKSEENEERQGSKKLEAKRARVENIVTSIKDNTQALDLSRKRNRLQQTTENNSFAAPKQARKRLFKDVIASELRSQYQMLRDNDVTVTQSHKRRRMDAEGQHKLNLSPNKNIHNAMFKNLQDQFDGGSDVINNRVISGDTYEILMTSLKQEMMPFLETIANNTAKRVLEELENSQTEIELRTGSTEDLRSSPYTRDLREQSDDRIQAASGMTNRMEESSSEQTEAISLVMKPTASFNSVESEPQFLSKPTSPYMDYTPKLPIGSSRTPPGNMSLSKAESIFLRSPKTPASSIPLEFYNSSLIASAFGRGSDLSASLLRNSLTSGAYPTPPHNLNSAFQYSSGNLAVPFLQNLYQQQSLAQALAQQERIAGDGMDLRSVKSHATRTSTREPQRTPAVYPRTQQEPKSEALSSRSLLNYESDRVVMSSIHEGLNAHHLKKAKLMFFYIRYPTANILKTYFPDVKFSRATTSQLIKWFSNFREFFYIQIEKFARQALNEGITDAEQLHVRRESEIFRAINQHYNKSNDFRVPDDFLRVILKSLREFFLAIQQRKDTDPSWKKPIYKIICKLDQHIPAVFKLPNVIDHLAKIY